jgi:hypothetical protein
MKIRNLLPLLALLIGPVFGHTIAEPDKNQVQPVASAPVAASSESGDLLKRLKDRVDPTYVARLKSVGDHSEKPRPQG